MRPAKRNFASTYLNSESVQNTAKAMLQAVLEEFSTPSMTTGPGPSDPNGKVKQDNQAKVAQAQETLKQGTPAASPIALPGMMSQEDFDKLPNAAPTDVIIKKGADGKYYFSSAIDPTKFSFFAPSKPGAAQPIQAQVQQVAEAYDFMDPFLFEDSDVLAPIDTMDKPAAPAPVVKIEVEVITPESDEDPEDDEDEEEEEKPKKKTKKKKKKDEEENEEESDEDAEYDIFASLPPLDLTNDIQRAVADAQQDMMPNVRVLPTTQQRAEVIRDGPIGTVKPVGKPSVHKILPLELDPEGLSVVGMDNSLGLRFL